jgi:hypothetical protein
MIISSRNIRNFAVTKSLAIRPFATISNLFRKAGKPGEFIGILPVYRLSTNRL